MALDQLPGNFGSSWAQAQNTWRILISYLSDTGWIKPVFQNAWTDYEVNGAFMPAAYRKGRDGTVTIRGLVKKATPIAGVTNIFNLPVGYRPSKNLIFTQWVSVNAGAVVGAVRVDVGAEGNVAIVGAANSVDYLAINFSFFPD